MIWSKTPQKLAKNHSVFRKIYRLLVGNSKKSELPTNNPHFLGQKNAEHCIAPGISIIMISLLNYFFVVVFLAADFLAAGFLAGAFFSSALAALVPQRRFGFSSATSTGALTILITCTVRAGK